MKKHLSPIANSLLQRCADVVDFTLPHIAGRSIVKIINSSLMAKNISRKSLGTSVDALVEEFELELKPETTNYSRNLVEFCSSKAIADECCSLEEKILDGSFSRFTFDIMLARENPSASDDESHTERMAKEKEDKVSVKEMRGHGDDTSLFYSDLMPLLTLVDEDRNVGEHAFKWLCSLLPLAADVVNAHFSFEALTSSTSYRLHFPPYDRYLKEIDKCIKYLNNQAPPKGVELAEDEFILHVEGTATTQRVVRHVRGTSWPGRLTLTNYALYFEASGVISYEDAFKIDLSNKEVDHKVRAGSTGPWGAPLFDKAVVYESSQLSEPVVLEFPEIASSTRRDLWLALTMEVILLHQFLSKFQIESPIQVWEMHARTILGILRLHAAREMLKVFPPNPRSFLIFSLFDELPRGDYVLEELSSSIKQINNISPCNAASLLKSLNMVHPSILSFDVKEGLQGSIGGEASGLSSLEMTISQAREEAKEMAVAKATTDKLKEEGIGDSVLVLWELMSPMNDVLSWAKGILAWERPAVTLFVLAMTMLVIYKEWIGYAISTLLIWGVWKIIRDRCARVKDKCNEIVVSTASDQTVVEGIVSAQHSLKNFHSMVQTTNIAILKVWSILTSRAPKHTNQVMMGMIFLAILLLVVPVKLLLMASILSCFLTNYKNRKSSVSSMQSNRRLREWWDSISIIPVRTTS